LDDDSLWLLAAVGALQAPGVSLTLKVGSQREGGVEQRQVNLEQDLNCLCFQFRPEDDKEPLELRTAGWWTTRGGIGIGTGAAAKPPVGIERPWTMGEKWPCSSRKSSTELADGRRKDKFHAVGGISRESGCGVPSLIIPSASSAGWPVSKSMSWNDRPVPDAVSWIGSASDRLRRSASARRD